MPYSENSGRWFPFRCPRCGRFVKNVMYEESYVKIERVFGICRRHGEVDVVWGSYEDVVGWPIDV